MKKSGVYLWIVVVAQALLLFIIFCSHGFKRPRGEEARLKHAYADIYGGLKTTLSMFKDDFGRLPTTAEGLRLLIDPPKEGPLNNWRGPYFDPPKVPKDPWGHEYVYRYPGIYSTNGYDLYSLGPDGISGTGDDIGNWQMSSHAPAPMQVSRETLSDRISRWLFFLPLIVPVLFGARLVVGVFSRRIRALILENPLADRVWLWMSLAAVIIWLSTFSL